MIIMATRKKIRGKTSKAPASPGDPLVDRLEARKQRIHELLEAKDIEQVLELIKQPENAKIVASFLSGAKGLVQINAVWALGKAARNEGTRDAVLEILKDTLSDENSGRNATWALTNAAKYGDPKTREEIVSTVMAFMNSEYFKGEANHNSGAYTEMVRRANEIIGAIDRAERAEWRV